MLKNELFKISLNESLSALHWVVWKALVLILKEIKDSKMVKKNKKLISNGVASSKTLNFLLEYSSLKMPLSLESSNTWVIFPLLSFVGALGGNFYSIVGKQMWA